MTEINNNRPYDPAMGCEVTIADALGLHVVVISDSGKMYENWIPKDAQGFCDVTDVNDLVYKHLRIECLNGGVFVACGLRGATLTRLGSRDSARDRMLLEHNCRYSVVGTDDNAIVFTEYYDNRSNIFHNYSVEINRPISIGRGTENDICCVNRMISKVHTGILWNGNNWAVKDINSINGTYLNGRRVSESYAACGDNLFIMGLKIVLGFGFVAISDGKRGVSVNSARVRRVSFENLSFSSPIGSADVDVMYNRSPRERSAMRKESIYIESPPASMAGGQVPFLLRMGSPAAMGGRALMSGNYIMAFTSLVMPFLTQGYTEKQRKEYEALRTKTYNAYLETKSQEIAEECRNEERTLSHTFPELDTVASWHSNSSRLWERRNTDDDFLEIRIGSGSRPMLVEIEADEERFEVEEDELETRLRQLLAQSPNLTNAPITTALTKDNIVGLSGTDTDIRRFVYSLMAQIAATHSYDEVKMVLLIDKEDLDYFEGFRFLPHMWDDEHSMRFLATEPADVTAISSYIAEAIGEDLQKPRDLKKEMKDRPYFVVFALNKKLMDTAEVLKEVLKAEKNPGVSIVAGMRQLPKECTKVFFLSDNENKTVYLNEPEHFKEFFREDAIDHGHVETALRMMANTRVSTVESAYALPKTLTFLEMFGVGKIEHLNIQQRWKDNNPVQSLAVPVGVGTDGELFTLDLHQKNQGPHGLVAGTTGSGKSEFLISYILSLAVSFSPDEVAFVLIDYKGGGLAGAFHDEAQGLHMPHLVATITNLDGAAIQRSLISINAELKRRQRALNEAKSLMNTGTMDIYDYQRFYRAGKLKEPMPHLFIISDEFAELKAQQPEFLDALISAARIGRSLGVHLILATQKPAGVVNDQIISNTRFRVCLRVADKHDSMDMLKRPEAGSLKDTGRFYLQVGNNDLFALGQSAWSGAKYQPQDEIVKQLDESISVLDSTGQSVISVQPQKPKSASDKKQIVAVVEYLSELAKTENIQPKSLWLDPLPEVIDLEKESRRNQPSDPFTVYAGCIDDPENQTVHPLYIDLLRNGNMLVLGPAASGKSNLLRTILFNVTTRLDPHNINFYTIDFSGRALNSFRKAPHCGAVLDDESESEIDGLFKMIRDIIDERKQLFSDMGVTDYESYLAVLKAQNAKPEMRKPLVLVVIDNMVGFKSFKKGDDYITRLQQLMRDGGSYGVRYIITASMANHVNMQIKAETPYRFAFHMKDRFEISDILNVKTAYVPPTIKGRAMCVYEGRPLEVHIAKFRPDLNALDATNALKDCIDRIDKKETYKAARLPVVNEDETYEEFIRDIAPGRIPLGYSMDAKKISLPLKQAFCLSLYFGNPDGAAPILGNFITAADRLNAEYLIVRANSDTLFDESKGLTGTSSGISRQVRYFGSTAEESERLLNELIGYIKARQPMRDAFCSRTGISSDAAEVADMIRENTKPVFVIFERYSEFCLAATDRFADIYKGIMDSLGRYWNMHFIACFQPGDTDKIGIKRCYGAFNPDEMVLLFGGQTDKQRLVTLKMDQAIREVLPRYSRAIMQYRKAIHTLKMPCGPLEDNQERGDDRSIFD